MLSSVATDAALLARLARDQPRDEEAWSRFVDVYTGPIYDLARRRGLQDADALEVTQEVFRSLSQAMPGFRYDPALGRFRGWVFTIASNAVNSFRRKEGRRVRGSGAPGVQQALLQQPAAPSCAEGYVEWTVSVALSQARGHFTERTWSAFFRVEVERRPVEEVASELGMTANAVHIARTRVKACLKRLIEEEGLSP
jgi:RNA polymerase sigma-70 factor (ECF subfamily)